MKKRFISKDYIVPVSILLFAILIRTFLFFSNRALWLDETLLAMNILEKSIADLVGKLENSQMAPIGFLLISKFVTLLFGHSERIFRLLPFLLSISSIFMFFQLAKKYLDGVVLHVALLFWAISPSLIRYSAEFKQYGFDVFLTLVLLLLILKVHKNNFTGLSIFILLLTGAVSVWFSFPVIFILGSATIFLGIPLLKQKRWYALTGLAGISTLWLILFYLSILPTTGSTINQSGMDKFFIDLFPPFPITSTAHIKWYLENPLQIFANPAGFKFPGLAAVFFILGCISLLKNKKLQLLALPMLLTILAAYLHKYPVHDRLVLFWTPMIYIFMANGIQLTRVKSATAAWILPLIILLVKPFVFSFNPILSPSPYPQVRETLTELSEHVEPQDQIYIYYKGEASFQYYGSDILHNHPNVQIGISARNEWIEYLPEIDSLTGKPRVWFYFTHICKWRGVDEKMLFLQYLDKNGTCLRTFENDGAWLYLYDLSNSE